MGTALAFEPREEPEAMTAKRIAPLDAATVDALKDEIRNEVRELFPRRAPRNDWSRLWQAMSVVMSVAALVFAAGGGWMKMSSLESRVNAVEIAVQQLVKQQADQKTDNAVMMQKLDQVSSTVSEIKGQMQRPIATPR
jgi:hypothetical protein